MNVADDRARAAPRLGMMAGEMFRQKQEDHGEDDETDRAEQRDFHSGNESRVGLWREIAADVERGPPAGNCSRKRRR